MPNNRAIALVALCGMAMVAGCSSRPDEVKLSGSVTLGGAPVETGEIRFEPQDGKGATAGAVIANGTYAATVPCGSKVIHITGLKKVGERVVYEGMPNSPKLPMLKEVGVLNETFNVTEAGTKDFQLKPAK
jgi:hypothetical protein